MLTVLASILLTDLSRCEAHHCDRRNSATRADSFNVMGTTDGALEILSYLALSQASVSIGIVIWQWTAFKQSDISF